ncbi:MAG: class I SAM-dependent methyltransferase, partial [Lachnospiraceae bacterium]|nr:class I SAM-dependent methyltransferase [Lachnospiraceae bacterium]
MDNVVNYYENYREEDRLSTNNARKIEFVTTTKMLDTLFDSKAAILDCAAGTGAYAFYYADKGNQVTATDITPRHIEYIKEILKSKSYNMRTEVLDATNMDCFLDNSFDVVLNM